MTTLDPATILTAVADRVASQVAAYGDRVSIDRLPQGTPWPLPYAIVQATGPLQPDVSADGGPVVDTIRVAVTVFAAPDDVADYVTPTLASLEGWAAEGLSPRTVGTTRIPQPEDDVIRTDVEVRYARGR